MFNLAMRYCSYIAGQELQLVKLEESSVTLAGAKAMISFGQAPWTMIGI